MVKPHIVAPSADKQEATPTSRSLDAESAFCIEPQNGVLEASGIANFRIMFAPPEVSQSVFLTVCGALPFSEESWC